MNENNHSTDSWAQDSYETGSTNPPKSRGGLVAVLLVLVILLCGATSYLGVLNIRLGLQLQQAGDTDMHIQFLPPDSATADPSETTTVTEDLLPGVEGRTVSAPERSFYHWPAGVVVTRVQPGSQADQAGLSIGDILTGINGRTITDKASLQAALQEQKAGDTISVTFCRDGNSYHSFSCTLE